MKKYFLYIFFILISYEIFSQKNPRKEFSEDISYAKQQWALKLLKAPNVYNGKNYDLSYHRIKWNINPDTLYISGEVTSYFKIIEPIVNKITFDFSSVMEVDSVKYHNSLISFTHNSGDTLVIHLPLNLSINQSDSVHVFYHGNPPQGSGFGSFIKDIHDTVPIIWTLSEPFGAKEWWPCKNNLSDKIDSIDIFITTPKKYKSASNGMLISENIQGDYKTAYWKHRYPIATYLIALAVTNYEIFSLYVKKNQDSLPIINYVYPEDIEEAKLHLNEVVPYIELFDSLFIPYPFLKEKYGHAQFGWGGGMEHQTMTFLGSFAHEIIAHELAHQWVGNMITCSNWHEIWINEGFATYFTGLVYNFKSPSLYWPSWKKIQIDKITKYPDGSLYCYDTTSVSRIFDSRLSYCKGAMLLHMLRWVVGDTAFFQGIRNYLSDTSLAYKYACSDDFIQHMEQVSDTSLTEFFQDWLYNEGFPIYTITCQSELANKWKVTINQTQSHASVNFFEMPVPIQFKNNTQDTILVFNNTYSGQEYIINLDFIPDTVILDPELWLVTKNSKVTLNVNEINILSPIKIFPNPISDFISISTSQSIQNIEICDINGQKVFSENLQAVTDNLYSINTSKLSQGIYLLKVVLEKQVIVKKIFKL